MCLSVNLPFDPVTLHNSLLALGDLERLACELISPIQVFQHHIYPCLLDHQIGNILRVLNPSRREYLLYFLVVSQSLVKALASILNVG